MLLELIEEGFHVGRDGVESKTTAVVFLLHCSEFGGEGGNNIVAFITNNIQYSGDFVDGCARENVAGCVLPVADNLLIAFHYLSSFNPEEAALGTCCGIQLGN